MIRYCPDCKLEQMSSKAKRCVVCSDKKRVQAHAEYERRKRVERKAK
jgi:hypothetical protein